MRILSVVLSSLMLAIMGCGTSGEKTAREDSARDSTFAALQARGAQAMGVDQYTSSHVFESLPDGGRIVLQRDTVDSAGAEAIREHMRDIARRFGDGDFTIPGFVHAQNVPGTAVMTQRRSAIQYAASALPRGGQVRITTRDSTAVAAVHAFLEFQRSEHHATAHEAMAGASPTPDTTQWTDHFDIDRADLAPTGRNTYFVLEPGYRLTLAGGGTRLIVTVLAETQRVDGVETRVVEERETKNGALVEVSRNFFAISKQTGDVYYFGEDVDMYRAGRVTSHEGSWRAGSKGARFGLMLPGTPVVGARFYQELAPKVALDRARILSLSDTSVVPAGTYARVLRTEETTPLEPDQREEKLYAPGVGLIQDGELKLVGIEKVARSP